MANTTLSEIYDLFMQTVTDYRLNELFELSQGDFENYVNAWLQFAITDFYVCDQDLNYDEYTQEFPETLSRDNKVILATLMMKFWMQKNVNDITQMNLHITDKDFKTASEAQNIREKVAQLNVVKEQCSQLLQDYSYRRVDWDTWFNAAGVGVVSDEDE
jgi:hypothetical protein